MISDPDPDLSRIQLNLFYRIQNPGLDLKYKTTKEKNFSSWSEELFPKKRPRDFS
jgi:hypothetical protein